jgi:diguanylate cyclase (GGDEF)-like protein
MRVAYLFFGHNLVMQIFKQREPLRLLSEIIQLFSLTKNLNREQWSIVYKDLWKVIVRDISLLFDSRPLVQIWTLDKQYKDSYQIMASSSQAIGLSKLTNRIDLAEKGCIFDVNDEHFLYVEIPFQSLNEEQKMLLCTITDHVKISLEWRESLEYGFDVKRRIDLLHKITVSIRGSLDLSDVLATTARDLGETLGISRCFIRRYDTNIPGKVLATEQEFTQPGLVKAADIIFDFETEWMKSLYRQFEKAASANEDELFPDSESSMLYLPDVSKIQDPDGLVASLAEAVELKTFLGVPLLYKGVVLGSLCFHQCQRERHFQKHDLEFIRQVADEATIAMTHAEMYRHIQQQAKTDSLTGLYNKASFHENLHQEVERARRSNSELSVMMIDLDFLKKVNDTYGHILGDEMIKLLGSRLRQSLRQIDIIARFGGDEFGVILPETSYDGAKLLGQRLAEEILATIHPIAGNLSASIGVAGAPPEKLEGEHLIELADKALYLAKKRGKSRSCGADELDQGVESVSTISLTTK